MFSFSVFDLYSTGRLSSGVYFDKRHRRIMLHLGWRYLNTDKYEVYYGFCLRGGAEIFIAESYAKKYFDYLGEFE